MGLSNWSQRPELNGVADPQIPAQDGASARGGPALVRGVMAEVARYAADQGGAIRTTGESNAYTVTTASGIHVLREGLRLVVRPHRANDSVATLAVDGLAPKAWVDAAGRPIAPGRIRPGRPVTVIYDGDLDAWRSDDGIGFINDDLAPAPVSTIKGNAGDGNADLEPEEVRLVIGLDHVANKSEEEMVASGAIADALATKSTPEQVETSLTSIRTDLNSKASTKYVDDSVGTISKGFAALQEDFGELDDEVAIIRSGQNSGNIIAETWAQLAAITPTLNAKAEIPGTAITTHTDPVAAGNPVVPDPGIYRGSTSPLGWKRVGPSTAAAAADEVGGSITTSLLARAPALQLAFRDPDTKRLTVLSPSDSAAFIQEIAVPTLYPTDLTDVVLKETSSIILPEDPQRSGDLLIQIIDKADAGFNFSSNPAVMDVPGTWGQKSGQWVNHGDVGTKAVAGVVRRVAGDGNTGPLTAKINLRVRRRVDAPMPSKLADAIFQRWTTDSDVRFRDAIRAEVDFLFKKGIYQKLKVWFLPGASRANNMVNLADPEGPLFIPHDGASGSIETAPYKYMKGNGVDQYIDTQRLPADIGMSVDEHFLAAKIYPGGGFYSTGYVVGNSLNYFLQPGRSDGQYAFRSGSGLEVNDAPLPNDRWCAMTRNNDAANLTGFVDETKIFTRPRALTGLPTRTLNLLAGNGSPGYGACSPQPLHGVVAGFGLLDGSVVDVIKSNKRIQAVMATIAGA